MLSNLINLITCLAISEQTYSVSKERLNRRAKNKSPKRKKDKKPRASSDSTVGHELPAPFQPFMSTIAYTSISASIPTGADPMVEYSSSSSCQTPPFPFRADFRHGILLHFLLLSYDLNVQISYLLPRRLLMGLRADCQLEKDLADGLATFDAVILLRFLFRSCYLNVQILYLLFHRQEMRLVSGVMSEKVAFVRSLYYPHACE